MKILIEGIEPDTTKTFACPRCSAVFEANDNEYRCVTNSSDIKTQYKMYCPGCHRIMMVEELTKKQYRRKMFEAQRRENR